MLSEGINVLIAADGTLADALCPQTDEGAQGDARDQQHQPVLKAEAPAHGFAGIRLPRARADGSYDCRLGLPRRRGRCWHCFGHYVVHRSPFLDAVGGVLA